MKSLNLLLFALLAGLAATDARASLIVATFEDLSMGIVPSPYNAIDWQGAWFNYSIPQSPYNAHSGSARVIIFGSGVVETKFSFYAPVIFEGAWFAGQGVNDPDVSFNLYSGVTLVASSSALTYTDTPAFLASGYNGLVDSVGVVADAGYFAMDDVTYQSVPEPALALPTFCLLGLWAAYDRRRRTLARNVPRH